MNNIFIYRNQSSRITGLAEALMDNANVNFVAQISLFDLLENYKPSIVFLNDDTCPHEHVSYAKNDFPDTKFILVTENNENPTEYDLVIHLKDSTQRVYLDYLANDKFFTEEVPEKLREKFKSDVLYISDEYESNEVLRNTLKSLSEKYVVKAYGKNAVECPSYLGACERNQYKNIIGSTKFMLLFDQKLLNTAMFCNKIPLVYSANPKTPYEFSNYSQLVNAIDTCQPLENVTVSTYKDFSKKMLQELYK